jgi:hypothetical protein
MDAETYRVDIAVEVPPPATPDRYSRAVAGLTRLLPTDAQTLRLDSIEADPDGLARVAVRVNAHGPAQALRTVAMALETMALEVGRYDDLGPMRRCVVERLD